MNNAELEKIALEFETALVGQRFGRVFPLSRSSVAIDFRLNGGEYLFINAESGDPRTYLIKRKLKELEKQSINPSPFILGLRKRLSGAQLKRVAKLADDRVLIFEFLADFETGESQTISLVAQMTGRSANVFVLDSRGLILDRLRETDGDGQEIATTFAPPARADDRVRQPERRVLTQTALDSFSEQLDVFYLAKQEEERFRNRVNAERKKLRAEISKRQNLKKRLSADLAQHGDADQWKRFGDLLLANAANARRDGDRIFVIDFYNDTTPEVEVAGDSNLEISEIAEKYFKRYTKARNAAGEISRRMGELDKELARVEKNNAALEKAIAERDESLFSEDQKQTKDSPARKKNKEVDFNGARHFSSSDGYEILVGKKAKDNDYLTFRVAKSLDIWLHAADYPGSHVVVRNPNRKDIPHKTLLEAAQLAAFYSDARVQSKAAVNYTQKKFVNKPRGAAPGLVRLASFKTILVVPKVPENKNAA